MPLLNDWLQDLRVQRLNGRCFPLSSLSQQALLNGVAVATRQWNRYAADRKLVRKRSRSRRIIRLAEW